MDWLRQHMRDHIPEFASPLEKVVNFRPTRFISANNPGAAALSLVRQAADLLRSSEDYSAEVEAHAKALADRTVAELKETRERIHSLELDCERVSALLVEAKDQTRAAKGALKQSEARIASMEAQLATAELRANSAEHRASEAEGLLKRVEDAIRTEILEPRRANLLTAVA